MRTGRYGSRTRFIALTVALLCRGPAAYAGAPADTPWWSQPAATAGAAFHSLEEHAASAWSTVTDLLSSPTPSVLGDDDRPLFAILESVGLRLGEVKIGGTLVRSTEYRLVASRAPSAAELERAERALETFKSQHNGLRAGAKERIARATLDLIADRNFVLTAMTIELTPWPSAKYEVHARENALGGDAPVK